MRKTFCNFMKGMGMGVAVGVAVGVVGTCYVKKNKKGLKRNAGRTLHSLGDLLENVTDMF